MTSKSDIAFAEKAADYVLITHSVKCKKCKVICDLISHPEAQLVPRALRQLTRESENLLFAYLSVSPFYLIKTHTDSHTNKSNYIRNQTVDNHVKHWNRQAVSGLFCPTALRCGVVL